MKVSIEEQELYAYMDRLHGLAIKHDICMGALDLHAGLSKGFNQPVTKRVNLDDYLRPSWRELEIQFIASLINLRNAELIKILKTYSFEDHEMIIYPFDYWEQNICR